MSPQRSSKLAINGLRLVLDKVQTLGSVSVEVFFEVLVDVELERVLFARPWIGIGIRYARSSILTVW